MARARMWTSARVSGGAFLLTGNKMHTTERCLRGNGENEKKLWARLLHPFVASFGVKRPETNTQPSKYS